ncbi:MAG: Ig-like domain-containing protein [Campylobacterota bacterium]|nr:Ig-like domain-containing protein [Campylobacterota bacterium]
MFKKNHFLFLFSAIIFSICFSGCLNSDSSTEGVSISKIEITPAKKSIAFKTTQQYYATLIYLDNSTKDVTEEVQWSSQNSEIAAIDKHGFATSFIPGTTDITATLDGIDSPASTLTVTAATLVSIQVDPTDPSTALGVDVQFTATGTYSDTTTQDITTSVTWSSATEATATISNAGGSEGFATTVDVGTTDITASLDGIDSPASTLTVTAATLESIAVTPTDPSTALGVDVQFTATGTYSDTTTQDITTSVTWSSATEATATISNAGGSEGFATTVDVGTTDITASLDGIDSPASTLTVTP